MLKSILANSFSNNHLKRYQISTCISQPLSWPLLQQLSDGVCALLDDATEHGAAGRLVVMTYSEFGRRAQENASGGTDHGAGSVAFVVGERVAGGLHGQSPRLGALVDGDVPSTVDFRSLYSAILRDWLNVPPAAVVGPAPVLGLLRV